MSGSLDHDRIRQLVDELSAALEARGVPGHVYLVGGGALITGYGRERTTKDVNARIDEAKDEVLAAAKTTAERNGLDERWLHVEAAQFVPRGEDVRAKTVLEQHRTRRHRRLGRVPAGNEGIHGPGAGPGSELL